MKNLPFLIREAEERDAESLFELNRAFNGEGVASAPEIQKSLAENPGEVVCVAEFEGRAAGFCCAQILRSFCYTRDCAELTELFIREDCRRRGLAAALIRRVEEICAERYGVSEFRLLTGGDNRPAQALYRSLGYTPADERLFFKDLTKE